MIYFCDYPIAADGLKCGLRVEKPGMCAEHQKKSGAEKAAEPEKSEEPAAAAPKKKGS